MNSNSANAEEVEMDDDAQDDLELFMESNPFVLPSDEEIFKLREQERKARKDRRLMIMKKKVHEKTTFSSRMSRTTAEGNFGVTATTADGVPTSPSSSANRGGLSGTGSGLGGSNGTQVGQSKTNGSSRAVASSSPSNMNMNSSGTVNGKSSVGGSATRMQQQGGNASAANGMHGGSGVGGAGGAGGIGAAASGQRELLANTASLHTSEHRRRDKENMTDYIAKKREIFLVQMSLDTKRAEIRKLEERALQREEALRKSEQMLEEDADRFDDFLRENDEKVQEAIRKAEIEAKAKQDKVVEIKRLNAAIATIRSELNKYEEQLEDCHQYKKFLDHLTPPEWFKEVEEKREREKKEREESFAKASADYKLQLEAYEMAIKREEEKIDDDADEEDDKYDDETDRKDAEDDLDGKTAGVEAPSVPQHPGEPPVRPSSPVEETPMFFTSSQQLLDVLAQLEEQNLFLIQNCQETEEALEELKQKHRDTKQRMDQEVDGLQVQIEQLRSQIAAEEEKARMLKSKAGEHSRGGKGSHETTLEDLSAKVADVYVRCGFDHDPSITTLQMLTNIEAKLEEYLAIVDIMPEENVEQMEKAKEKERRHRAREEKLEQQRKEQEKRVQRALERAQAPVHKKTGKPVMTRSQPPSRKKKNAETGPKKTDEEEELQAFLSRDY